VRPELGDTPACRGPKQRKRGQGRGVGERLGTVRWSMCGPDAVLTESDTVVFYPGSLMLEVGDSEAGRAPPTTTAARGRRPAPAVPPLVPQPQQLLAPAVLLCYSIRGNEMGG
jgi:hypothetical protein